MTPTCKRCGGLVIGEQSLDYYQTHCWRCVNCGWHRRETQVYLGRPITVVNRSVYK